MARIQRRFFRRSWLWVIGGCFVVTGCTESHSGITPYNFHVADQRTPPNEQQARLPLPQPTDSWSSEVIAANAEEVEPVPPLPPTPKTTDEPSEPATLAQLQQAAIANSPAIQQAVADIAARRGAALQAGLYPNPTVGYQGDQIGSGRTAGQQGIFFNQTIITYGKLELAQAAALADVTKAEAALRATQTELAADVRSRYFALMAAEEAVRIAEQMAQTSEALFERIKKLQEGGQAIANYEISQARVSAVSARSELAQAINRRVAARKQLAAITGEPEASLNATADQPLPRYSFEAIKQRALTNHSELLAAMASVQKARYEVTLARIQPKPNLETNTYVQYDYQTRTPQVGVQLGVNLPIHDRNQGNIAQTEAMLARTTKEADRVKLDLVQRLADAYERYSSNVQLLEQYRTSILPDQLKAFQGISKRYEVEPGKVSFPEVIQTQINLAKNYQEYITALTNAWQAVADLSRIAQLNDLYRGLTRPANTVDSWSMPK